MKVENIGKQELAVYREWLKVPTWGDIGGDITSCRIIRYSHYPNYLNYFGQPTTGLRMVVVLLAPGYTRRYSQLTALRLAERETT